MANKYAAFQQFSCDNSLDFEELLKTETPGKGMAPQPNDMDKHEHAESTSRSRTTLRSGGATTAKSVGSIRKSDSLHNDIPVISFDRSRNDANFQDWCEIRGDGRVSIPSELNKPRSKFTTDEETVVTDALHSMSQSSQTNGGFRCLLQSLDSIRIAASTRTETKKTALEESLMQQLADMQSLHNTEINEMEIKLHQREAAIKTLERALCLRNDAVEEVRDDLDKCQANLFEAERTIKRLEQQLSTSKSSNLPTHAVEEFSSRRTQARRRRSYSATPRLNGHSSESNHRRDNMSLGERTINRLEQQFSTNKSSNSQTLAVEGFSSRRTQARRRRSYSATPRLNGHSSGSNHRRGNMSLGERTINRLEQQLSTNKSPNPQSLAVEGFSSRGTQARRRRSYSATPRLNGHSSGSNHRRDNTSLGALFDRDRRIANKRGRMRAKDRSILTL